MAQLLNPKFGNLSGRMGDFVFMTKNGKTFMYYRPKPEKKKPSVRKKNQYNERVIYYNLDDSSV